MKLLKLSCDNPKFKTINFKSGLNIIAGLQITEEERKTINGIGKSLSLNIIHYILGAKLDKNSKIKKHLETYGIFTLIILHDNKEYIIKKDFSKTYYYLNDIQYDLQNYLKELTNLVFKTTSEISFRQLFNCFARRYETGKNYYTNYLTQQGLSDNDFQQMKSNFVLLGIDIKLINEYAENKEKITELKKASNPIKEYEKTLEKTNIKDLDDEIKKLKIQLKDFKIAENYDNDKREADKLTNDLNKIRNELFEKEKKLGLKLKELNSINNIDIDVDLIEKLYNESKFFFDEKITKRLEDAQNFHNTLIKNRKERLNNEIKELKISIDYLNQQRNELSEKRDKIIKLLDNTGALEEYKNLNTKISEKEKEKNELTKYENILTDLKKNETYLKEINARLKRESNEYLNNSLVEIEKKEDIFREIVKKFYDNHGGSLKLKETENAKYLYDIKIEIPKDDSQGVNGVKIFCYDVLLYKLNKNLLNFMAHDGCLFSGMDPRQESIIFKIILELIKQNNDFQYFINLNQNTLNEIIDENNTIISSEDKKYLQNSIILELLDKNPENWLLGESFN